MNVSAVVSPRNYLQVMVESGRRAADKPLVLVIFVCALVIRVLFINYMGFDEAGIHLFPDGKDYDALAMSLAHHLGYEIGGIPNTFRPPGYPFFLAGIYLVWGHSLTAVQLIQSLLGAVSCVMIFLIAQRLFNRDVGILSGMVACAYPFLIVYTGLLLSESVFVFLSLLFLYALLSLKDTFTLSRAVLVGVLLGCMNLTRPVAMLMPALIFCWGWVEFGSKRKAGLLAGTILIGMILTIAPWTARNYFVTHSPILIADHHWAALYSGNNEQILHNPEAIGGWIEPPQSIDYRNGYLTFIREHVLHDPWALLRLEAHKLHRLWSIVPTSSKTTVSDTVVSAVSYGVVFPLFIIGLVLSLFDARKPWILIMWLTNFLLLVLVVYGSTRFRSPLEPVIVIWAAVGLQKMWQKIHCLQSVGNHASRPCPD